LGNRFQCTVPEWDPKQAAQVAPQGQRNYFNPKKSRSSTPSSTSGKGEGGSEDGKEREKDKGEKEREKEKEKEKDKISKVKKSGEFSSLSMGRGQTTKLIFFDYSRNLSSRYRSSRRR